MKMLVNLASLALRCTTGMSDATVNQLTDRFSDASQRLNDALQAANARAWRTLEISLAGDSWLDRAKGVIAAREEQVLRDQIQGFLASQAVADLNRQSAAFRKSCWKELQRARKEKLIPGADLHVGEAASDALAFARYTDPGQLLAAELNAVAAMADEVRRAGYHDLARFIALCPAPGPYPLLVIAVRYFFRRAVEEDPRLSATWQFQQLEGLAQAQEAGFSQVHDALRQHGDKMERLLDDVLEVVTETRDDVKAIREEMQQLRALLAAQQSQASAVATAAGPTAQQLMDLYQAVLQAVHSGKAPPVEVAAPIAAIAPAPTAPPTGDNLGQVQSLLNRCQALPKQQQRQLPALFRVVGKLKAAAGNQQTRSRLFPLLTPAGTTPPKNDEEFLAVPASVPPPLPETPKPTQASAASVAAPRLMRIQGKPISPLFQPPPQTPDAPPARTDEPPAAPAGRNQGKRLISKLFEQEKKG